MMTLEEAEANKGDADRELETPAMRANGEATRSGYERPPNKLRGRDRAKMAEAPRVSVGEQGKKKTQNSNRTRKKKLRKRAVAKNARGGGNQTKKRHRKTYSDRCPKSLH